MWTIIQTLSTIAILRENTYWSALGVAALGAVSFIVFLLSFKYGTKNITRLDTMCLIGALAAIGIWIFAHNVLLSVVLVTVIDFVGFIPTYRKVYEEPYSETVFLYVCSGLSNLFSLLALTVYSVESSLYVASLIVSNTLMVSIVAARRSGLSQAAE